MAQKINIFWFRRDLRLEDNAGLYQALRSSNPVFPIFIFDQNILDELEEKKDDRIVFIRDALQGIQKKLVESGSSLTVYYSRPEAVFQDLLGKHEVGAVFTNSDYEPYAQERDASIAKQCKSKGISFQSFKDQVIFEKDEILKDDGKPYTVFTPYSKKWLSRLNNFFIKPYPTVKYFKNFFQQKDYPIPPLEAIGFKHTDQQFPPDHVNDELIRHYAGTRDFPGIHGTSHLGVHLRFGTISIRHLMKTALHLSHIYAKELIWREFYQMILYHFPQVGKGKAFKPEYEFIEWRNNEQDFEHWCNGTTGYPIVDAGMRELNATGFMHNRVRMVTASFLSKHLLIDWRWGEAYFAKKLLDYDLASNNGGWQWAAGSGCDAAPYFRVFNPELQAKKFDPKHTYIHKWVPELNEFTYPEPIVNHEFARKRALDAYAKALKRK